MTERAPPADRSGATGRTDRNAMRGGHRLFFALWPSAALQTQLEDAAHGSLGTLASGRKVERTSLHLTLAFLGAVPAGELATVKACALTVSGTMGLAPPGLEVRLDGLEYWSRARVLCATASRPSRQASALSADLKRALCSSGLRPDLKPFRAHVTLLRHLGHRPSASERGALHLSPVVWTFGEFSLVDSRPARHGSVYSVLHSWPLCRA